MTRLNTKIYLCYTLLSSFLLTWRTGWNTIWKGKGKVTVFFYFHRWFQRFCSPQEIPVLDQGPLFCLILCLALLSHLHRPQFLQAMRSNQWRSFHSCCKRLKVSSKHQGAAPLAPWLIGGNIFWPMNSFWSKPDKTLLAYTSRTFSPC